MKGFKRKAKVGDFILIKKCKCMPMVGMVYMIRKITKTGLFKRLYHIDDKFSFQRKDFKVFKEDAIICCP